MTFSYGPATLVLADGRRFPLISIRYLTNCSAWRCTNRVRRGGPARCAAHATTLDVAFQVSAPIFQADQFMCPHCQRDAATGEHGVGFCARIAAAPAPEIPAGMKRCSKCKLVKPATAEFFSRLRATTFRSWCRKCCSAATMASKIRHGHVPSADPLKRLALAFSCAKRDSEQEAKARAELVAAVMSQQSRSAA